MSLCWVPLSRFFPTCEISMTLPLIAPKYCSWGMGNTNNLEWLLLSRDVQSFLSVIFFSVRNITSTEVSSPNCNIASNIQYANHIIYSSRGILKNHFWYYIYEKYSLKHDCGCPNMHHLRRSLNLLRHKQKKKHRTAKKKMKCMLRKTTSKQILE